MSYQSTAWYRHTLHYLEGIDPSLADLFVMAMRRAGFPEIGEADALELILADFLAGNSGVRLPSEPKEEQT